MAPIYTADEGAAPWNHGEVMPHLNESFGPFFDNLTSAIEEAMKEIMSGKRRRRATEVAPPAQRVTRPPRGGQGALGAVEDVRSDSYRCARLHDHAAL